MKTDRLPSFNFIKCMLPVLIIVVIFISCYVIYHAGMVVTESIGSKFALNSSPDHQFYDSNTRPGNSIRNKAAVSVMLWEACEVLMIVCLISTLGMSLRIVRHYGKQIGKACMIGLSIVALIGLTVITNLFLCGNGVGPRGISETIEWVTRHDISDGPDNAPVRIIKLLNVPRVVDCVNFLGSITILAGAIAFAVLSGFAAGRSVDRDDLLANLSIRAAEARRLAFAMLVCSMLGGLVSVAYFRIGASFQELPQTQRFNELEQYAIFLGLLFAAGATFLIVSMYLTTMSVLVSHVPLDDSWGYENPAKQRIEALRSHGIYMSGYREKLTQVVLTFAPAFLTALIPLIINYIAKTLNISPGDKG